MPAHAIITATATVSKARVYLTACDAWTTEPALAEVLPPEDQLWRLAFANRLREVTGASLQRTKTPE